MLRTCALLFALSFGAWGSQDLSKLPEWARAHAESAAKETAPPEADAWILLDRTEFAYAGDGEIRLRRLRLVKVLGERGLAHRVFILHGLGGRASKVKKLKGWNLRPDGELEKLDQDTVVTLDSDEGGSISTDVTTGASLQRVVKGSLVAFESLQELHHPIGPAAGTYVLEASPIRRWELETAKQEGWFTHLKQVTVAIDLTHFAPWIPQAEFVPGQRVAASQLPALPKDERLHPHERDMLPRVDIRFQDPDLKGFPGLKSWNELSQWTQANYLQGTLGSPKEAPLPALKHSHSWLCHELTYRQVYLRPDRGWVPEKPEEVARKRYGDCKDLACWLIQEVRQQGLEAFPVFARIGEGEIPEDEPPSSMAFNHVIAAVRLDKTLGFPGEVEAGGRRYLLIDATDRFTPLGQLNEGHRGRRVMIAAGVEALWVRVPDAAILQPRVSIRLEGQINQQGAMEASLTFKETGDAMGLRRALLQGGPSGLREHLMKEVMDLPPTARLDVGRQGDPLEGDRPLEVVVNLRNPEGFQQSAGEWNFFPMGLFPQPGAPLMKAGKPRTLPIESRAEGILDLSARLKLPFSLQPVLANKTFDTPFRRVEFTASVALDQASPTLNLHFFQERHPIRYGNGDLEKGVSEWKKDRSEIRTLVTDGLAFKPLP